MEKKNIVAKSLKPLNKEHTRRTHALYFSSSEMTGQSIWANEKDANKIAEERMKLSYMFSVGSGCQWSGSISDRNHYPRGLGSDRIELFS